MANKKDISNKDLDSIENFDWPEFDFDDVDPGGGSKDDRKPVAKAAKSALKAGAKVITDPRVIEQTLKRTLPGSYGKGVAPAFEAARQFKGLYDTTFSELNETQRDLRKSLGRLTPSLKGKVPDAVFKLLEKAGITEDASWSKSAGQQRTENVNGRLEEIFGAVAQGNKENREQAQAEKVLNQTRANKRFQSTTMLLSSIDNSLNLSRDYQDRVDSRWKRMMLESSLTQQYMLGDFIESSNKAQADMVNRLGEVVKNTALPEAQKIKQSEEFQRMTSQKMLGRISDGLFGNTADYLGKTAAGISKNLNNHLKDKLLAVRRGGRDIADLGAEMAEMQANGMGDDSTVMEMLFGMAADWGSNKYGKRAQDAFSKIQGFNKHQGRAEDWLESGGRKLNEQAHRRDYNYTIKGSILDGLRGMLHKKSLNGNLGRGDAEAGHMPDNFNKLTNRAIVEIIPGLLARMHHELVKTRTGDATVPMIRYSMQTGTFTDMNQTLKEAKGRIAGSYHVERNQKNLDELMREVDPDMKLGKKERAALRRHVAEINMRHFSFSPQNIGKGEIYGKGTDDATKKKLQEFVAQRYSLNGDGTFNEDNADAVALRNAHSKKSNAIGSGFADPTGLVRQLIEEGYREEMIELGIITISGGMPRIDFDKAIDFYLGIHDELPRPGDGPANGPSDPTPVNGRKRRRRRKKRPAGSPPPVPDVINLPTVNDAKKRTGPGSIRARAAKIKLGSGNGNPRLKLGRGSSSGTIRPAPNRVSLGTNRGASRGTLGMDYEKLGEIFNIDYDRMVQPIIINGGFSPPETPNVQDSDYQYPDQMQELIEITRAGQHERSEQLGWLNLMVEEIMDITTDGRLTANVTAHREIASNRFKTNIQGKLAAFKKRAGELGTAGLGHARTGLGMVRGHLDRMKTRAQGLFKSAGDMATAGGKVAKGWLDDRYGQIRDIYVKGMNSPALQANLLKAGKYRDQLTNNVITRLSDIKGAVIDEDGNVVLTLEQIKQGLRDRSGGEMVLKGVKWVGDKATALKDGVLGKFGSAGDNIRKGFDWAMDKFNTLNDVYVKGENKPRLLAYMVRNGSYIDEATKTVIKKLSDIKGNIVDLQGNLVLSAEDMRTGLVDRWGRSLKSGFGGIMNLAKGHLQTLRANLSDRVASVKGFVSKQWGRLTGMFSKGGKGGIKAALAGVDGTEKSIANAQLQIQVQILENLIEMNPGRRRRGAGVDENGVRQGSWMEQMKDRAMGLAGSAKDKITGSSAWGALGGLLDGGKDLLKKLFGGKKERDEEEDEDDGFGLSDAADLAEIRDGLRGEGRGGRRRRGPGRMKRGWNRVKGWGRKVPGAGRLGKLLPNGGVRAGLGRVAASTGARMAAMAGLEAGFGGALTAGAASAGTALAGAGTMIGTGLAAAGTGLAALLASPIVLGALAVGAVAAIGYGAWKLYDAYKDRPLQKFRLAQYGHDGEDSGNAKDLLEFEERMLPYAKVNATGATIEIDEQQLQEAASVFNIDFSKQTMQLKTFSDWLEGRFKPVFIANCVAMAKVGADYKKLGDNDDKIDKDKKVEFLSAIRMTRGLMHAYRIASSPWGTKTKCLTDTSAIDALYKDAEKKAQDDLPKGVLATLGAIAAKVSPVGWVANTETGKQVIAGALGAVGLGAASASVGEKGSNLEKFNSDPANPSGKLYPTTSLDALRTARFKTYGLAEMDRNGVRALIELEQAALPMTKAKADGSAVFRGTVDDLIDKVGPFFGAGDIGSDSWAQFVSWFEMRFLPVYLKHVGFVKKLYPAMNPGEAHLELEADDQYDLALDLSTAQGSWQNKRVPVWDIPLGPMYGVKPNMSKSSIDGNLAALKDGMTQKRLDEESGKKGNVKGQASENGTGIFDKVKDFFGLGKKEEKPAVDPSSPYATFLAARKTNSQSEVPKSSTGGGLNIGGGGGYDGGGGTSGGGGSGSMDVPPGQEVIINHPGGGDKGDVNSLPFPKGGKGYEEHKDLIAAVAAMTGMPADMMATVIAAESMFDSRAKPGTSAAQGLGQFVPGTWAGMMKKYAKAYGIAPGTPATDPRANALFTALYMRDNAQEFEKQMGRKATDVDLYMSHFLGGAGWRTFLKNPGRTGGSLYPSFERANPTIFKTDKGKGRSRTVEEITAVMAKKVADNRKLFGNQMGEYAKNYKPGGNIATAAKTEVAATGTAALPNAGVQPGGQLVQPTGQGGDTGGTEKAPGIDVVAMREASNSSSDISKPPSPAPSAQPQASGLQPASYQSAPSSQPQQMERANNSSAQSTVTNDRAVTMDKEFAEIQRQQLDTQKSMNDKLGGILAGMQAIAKQMGTPPPQQPAPTPVGPMSMSKERNYTM